jgi:hypothetical protein
MTPRRPALGTVRAHAAGRRAAARRPHLPRAGRAHARPRVRGPHHCARTSRDSKSRVHAPVVAPERIPDGTGQAVPELALRSWGDAVRAAGRPGCPDDGRRRRGWYAPPGTPARTPDGSTTPEAGRPRPWTSPAAWWSGSGTWWRRTLPRSTLDFEAARPAAPSSVESGDAAVGGMPAAPLGRGVTIEPNVVLDFTDGPIWLDDAVSVRAFTRLAGPAYVGRGTRCSAARTPAPPSARCARSTARSRSPSCWATPTRPTKASRPRIPRPVGEPRRHDDEQRPEEQLRRDPDVDARRRGGHGPHQAGLPARRPREDGHRRTAEHRHGDRRGVERVRHGHATDVRAAVQLGHRRRSS